MPKLERQDGVLPPQSLTSDLREQYQAMLDHGHIEMGYVGGQPEFHVFDAGIGDFFVRRKVDLERGVLLADGQVVKADTPLKPAFATWLHEKAKGARPK